MYISYIFLYLTWPLLIVISYFTIRWVLEKMEKKWESES